MASTTVIVPRLVLPLLLLLLAADCAARDYHTHTHTRNGLPENLNRNELRAEYWREDAQDAIRKKMTGPVNPSVAKNVIMFLGDGMSMTTLAAARARLGQLDGKPGEEAALSFESFPVVGLSKTYCVDSQVADSACSASAYLCGAKANDGTIGVDATVKLGDCVVAADNDTHLESIAVWALRDGRDVGTTVPYCYGSGGGANMIYMQQLPGIVTTTRVTHASPAGVYAHVADRDFEHDGVVKEANCDPEITRDIAYQLVHGYPGTQIKVILGGGRRNFLSPKDGGLRRDDRDLTREWLDNKRRTGIPAQYVRTLSELQSLDVTSPDHVLGLFADSHLPFRALADTEMDPSLERLTEFAINKLSQNKRGYFLFVEGGRIDHAHHDNWPHLALDETLAMADAVRVAARQDDTLVVVTADHSHVMAYNGYSPRGQNILGTVNSKDRDRVPYMTLSYTNGPGFRQHTNRGTRPDVTLENEYGAEQWRAHVDAPLSSETHGGEDVAVFARGPQQHLFTGLYEQSHLPHLMGYAACIGPGQHAPECNAATSHVTLLPLMAMLMLLAFWM